MIRKWICILMVSAFAVIGMEAQEISAQRYRERYEMMVRNLGPSGIGIETLLDKWRAAYPEDGDEMIGRFAYYFNKCQETKVVTKDADTFLGQKPVLTLKDSLGNPVNYFQETFYDDELFGKAKSAIDRAVQVFPDRLDLRLYRINALVAYEKESPDMAMADMKALIDYHYTQHPKWEYPGEENAGSLFPDAIQEICAVFFRNATKPYYDAFRDLSSAMLRYEPKSTLFLGNLGSYYFVAEGNYKTALKYYKKVLKIKKDDMPAIKNCIIMARKRKDAKMEKKYLKMMAEYAESGSDKIRENH